ncbi:heterokaryon incompatibility [Apiospora saccharicola]|uniref:Heterokaryon incompatibility n=1 Tax=Apiospora saccharicola TaxID=335842 RepID=A0ABR1W6S9_9PEZI
MAFDFHDCSWGQRAWTYQEKVMSKCLLVFGKAGLHLHEGTKMHLEGSQEIDDYYGGIRGAHVHRDLFWLTSPGNWSADYEDKEVVLQRLMDRSRYVAPSWSWASRNNHTGHAQCEFRMYDGRFCDFQAAYGDLEVSVGVRGLNPYGEIKDGSLTLTTITLPVPADTRLLRDRRCLWELHEGS